MNALIGFLQGLVRTLAEVSIPLVQLVGILVLIVSAARCAVGCLRREPRVGVTLAHGMALALEFMLGAEVLHIVLAHDWKELGVLGIGVVIHIMMTLLLHREVKEGKEE